MPETSIFVDDEIPKAAIKDSRVEKAGAAFEGVVKRRTENGQSSMEGRAECSRYCLENGCGLWNYTWFNDWHYKFYRPVCA
ncbi:MAG: hypothetical protein GWN86_06890 [Desulfobacterales bacterium]|nr:hypothetical protein [Desulfobacterales bacterium]